MATIGASIEAAQERRSLEAHLHMPIGGDYTLTLYRQIVLRDGEGAVLAASRDDQPVVRLASQIAAETVTVQEQEVTGAFAMEVIAAFFDKFDGQDHPEPDSPP